MNCFFIDRLDSSVCYVFPSPIARGLYSETLTVRVGALKDLLFMFCIGVRC